jgi:hypothetical protein
MFQRNLISQSSGYKSKYSPHDNIKSKKYGHKLFLQVSRTISSGAEVDYIKSLITGHSRLTIN